MHGRHTQKSHGPRPPANPDSPHVIEKDCLSLLVKAATLVCLWVPGCDHGATIIISFQNQQATPPLFVPNQTQQHVREPPPPPLAFASFLIDASGPGLAGTCGCVWGQ